MDVVNNSVRAFLTNPERASLHNVLVQLVQTISESLSGPHSDHGSGNLFLPETDEEDVIGEQLRRDLADVIDLRGDDLLDLANCLASFDRTLQQLATHREDADRSDYTYVLRFFSLTPGYYLNAAATLAWQLDPFYYPSRAED